MAHGGGCAAWTPGLMALPGQPWEEPEEGALSSGGLALGPHLHCASLRALLGLCRWMGLGWADGHLMG